MATIRETFEAKHRRSWELAQRAAEVFPSGVTHDIRAYSPFPLYVERASGSRKWDVDGNEYVDYFGGHGALILGHNHPEVIAAVHAALDRGTHFGASHDLELAWGEHVQAMVPCAERVRFTSSGTEATMMALRLARAYTGRERVIKFEEHFHGWHDLAVGRLEGEDPHPRSPGVPSGFYDALTILPQGEPAVLAEALAARDVAAVILEPTGAHWGAQPLDPRFLREARRLTEEAGSLLVFDEVITGFRMAPGGAQERYGVTPDLSTHAKIVAGGLPGGCVAGRADVLEMMAFRPGEGEWNARQRVSHPGTFNANPASAAAGSTALGIIARGGIVEAADAAAAKIVRGLNAMFREEQAPASAWTESSMWHVNLGYEAPMPADLAWDAPEPPRGIVGGLGAPLRQALMNHGVDPMGTGGMTSAVHSNADIERTIEAYRRAIRDLRAERRLD